MNGSVKIASIFLSVVSSEPYMARRKTRVFLRFLVLFSDISPDSEGVGGNIGKKANEGKIEDFSFHRNRRKQRKKRSKIAFFSFLTGPDLRSGPIRNGNERSRICLIPRRGKDKSKIFLSSNRKGPKIRDSGQKSLRAPIGDRCPAFFYPIRDRAPENGMPFSGARSQLDFPLRRRGKEKRDR